MKKQLIYNAFWILAIIGGVASCNKFDEINTNPNRTSMVSSNMLASTMIIDITKNTITSTKGFMQPMLLGKYVTWGENQEGFQFNRLGRAGFGRLTLLRNIKPMVDAAPNEGLSKSYRALGHFISAWQFFYTTMQVGDIPFSQAIKGETEGIIQPVYDTQKEVFLGILNHLDSAQILFETGTNFTGDPVYNGDVSKWRRLSNAFALHVLINLHKKTADTDLRVIQRFQDIVSNRPLFQSYADDFALTYKANAGQNYPWSDVPAGSGNSFVKSNYTMLTKYLIDPLVATADRRLFYYAKPSPVKLSGGLTQQDWAAYPGVEPGESFTELSNIRVNKDYADVNDRYVKLVDAEPVSLLSFSDQQFILAEARLRGWITQETAEFYYKSGVQEALKVTAAFTPDNAEYHHNMKIDEAYVTTFMPTVTLSGSFEQQLEKIIVQKYLANFMKNPNYNSWYEHRRTGYPNFWLNAASNLNVPTNKFPVRWMYPSRELDYNTENLEAAIQRQFNGNDDFNEVMWILK
jgi:hypothetical protein